MTIRNMLILLVAFMAGWNTNGWRLGLKHQESQTLTLETINRILKNYRALEKSFAGRVAEIDNYYTEKLSNERKKSADTIAAIRNGSLQLRDRFRCPAPAGTGWTNPLSGSGMDHETGKRGLWPDDAEFLVRESDRADEAVIQLQGCQDYIRASTEMINVQARQSP